MTVENCLVCASDEGIFLDVLEQPTIYDKAKNCQLEKVSQEGPSTKVCHKCAFEIEQCNSFVEKIRVANKLESPKRACCVLCFDAYNKDIFFDLSKQKIGINELVQQIQDIFADELKNKEFNKQLICLSCRYCVDLLTDLKHLSDEIPGKLKSIVKNGISAADLPKTRTSIVNRKTTFIQSSNLDLNTPSDTDSESSSIMSSRRKVNKINKSPVAKSQRKCDQCKKGLKNAVDMYRIYHTGWTVCKQCWLTIDPGKVSSKKRKKINYMETKLCSVLLKDVSQMDPKDEKVYKMDKDEKGNTGDVITDDSDGENSIKSKKKKIKLGDAEIKKNVTKESLKENIEITKSKSLPSSGRTKKESEENLQEEINVKTTRSRRRKESEQSIQEVEVKPTRTRKRKESEQSVQEEIEIKPTRGRTGKESEKSEKSVQESTETKLTRTSRRRKESEQSSQEENEVKSTRTTRKRKESEQSSQEENEVKSTRTTRKRKESEQSIQEEEENDVKSTKSGRSRKDSEQSLQESTKNVEGTRRRKESEQNVQDDIEINVDVDSDSAPTLKKMKKSSAESQSIPKQSKSKVINQSKTSTNTSARKRGRSSSIESTGSTRKSARNVKKSTVQELEEIIEIDDDSDSFKLQNEKAYVGKDLVHKTEKGYTDKLASGDEHSDVDSNTSEIKVHSKRSSPISSKESTPAPKFKTPSKIDQQESPNAESMKNTIKETKDDKAKSLEQIKSEGTKPDDSGSLKSIEVDTSESEEIDILKSTDEETKREDTVETKTNEQDTSKSLVSEESISKPEDNDDSRSEKDEVEKSTEKEISFQDNSKTIEDSEHIANNIIQENESALSDKSLTSGTENISEFEVHESLKINDEKDSQLDIVGKENLEEHAGHSDEINEHNAQENETEEIEDEDVSESTIENEPTTSKRSSLNSPRSPKSKASDKKKSRKSENEKFADDIIVYDSSDSELTKNIEQQADVTYTCTICDKVYENKFIGLQHELTHMKTLEIKLEKIKLPKTNNKISELETEHEISCTEETLHSSKTEEKMTVDEEEETEKEKEKEILEEKSENEILEKEIAIDENEQEIVRSDDENEDIATSEAEKAEEIEETNGNVDDTIEKNCKTNDDIIESDNIEESEFIQNDDQVESESEVETTSRRSSRQSRKMSEKRDRKSRGRRKTTNNIEEEITTAIESESDKIAEAVQETLNDMAELHGRIKESASLEEVPELNKSTESTENHNNENKTIESTTDNLNESETKNAQSTENENNETEKNKNEISKSTNDIEFEVNEEPECSKAIPVVDLENDSPKEVIDLENEETKQAEESEVEITEIDDAEAETIESTNNIESEPVDVSENEDCEVPKPDDDIEIEEVNSSKKSLHEDENTVDSVTEINVTSADEPNVENNEGNPRRNQNESAEINDDDDNNTEEEEALAQESLEELLQRKGLQIIDEFAESVTDGDEESEKDVNLSSEKENCQKKKRNESDLEIKISDAESTEILEISNRSTNKQKEIEIGVIGESQITQDVDVVEEVINDDDQPQSDVVQEVEVESNGNCLEVANNVVGEVTEVFSVATDNVEKRLDLQTEPISDDETDILPQSFESTLRENRNSQDMPSLDPICEDIDDE